MPPFALTKKIEYKGGPLALPCIQRLRSYRLLAIPPPPTFMWSDKAKLPRIA
jgi:hypothetical protein